MKFEQMPGAAAAESEDEIPAAMLPEEKRGEWKEKSAI
jgi:hypothetical protein